MARSAGDFTQKWAEVTSITFTSVTDPTSLPDNGRTGLSDAFDISSYDNVTDVLVGLTFGVNTGGALDNNPFVKVLATAPSNASSVGNVTLASSGDWVILGTPPAHGAGGMQYSRPYSVLDRFGSLPRSLRFGVENQAGQNVESGMITAEIVFGNAQGS